MTINASAGNPETKRTLIERLSALIRDNFRVASAWVCLTIASLVAFWATEGTEFHQLAAGLLMSSSTLFILIALFECLWWLVVDQSS
jgi:hypothetical protein